MENLWKMRDKNRKLAPGTFGLRYEGKFGFTRAFAPVLIRRREVSLMEIFREVGYLQKFLQLKEWGMKQKNGRHYVAYILIPNMSYLSWQETRLGETELLNLRKKSQDFYLKHDIDL